MAYPPQDDSAAECSKISQPCYNKTTVPRIFWATETGNEEIILTALKEGDDINSRCANGQTSLHCAVKLGHNSIFNLLLNSNADITAVDKEFRTPLHYAANAGANMLAARMLLDLGADVNALDNTMLTPLHLAMRVQGCYSVELVALLLERGADVNAFDQHGRTPLHKAANDGRCDIATMLLDRGADVNALDHSKNTPLHAAVKCFDGGESMGVIKLLLERGASAVVNAADENGRTALSWAALGESEEVVELLLESGADVNAVDDTKRTPLDRAIENTIGMLEPIPDGIQKLLQNNGGLRGKHIKPESTGTRSHNTIKLSAVGVTHKGISLSSKKSDIQICACKADDSCPEIVHSLHAEGSLRDCLSK